MPRPTDSPATFFESPEAFARWLRRNHRTSEELWVGYHKKGTGRPSITWPESVKEALCFGWIDGLRRSIDEESYKIRFTPRKPGSNWSRVNLGYVQELIAAGRMEPAGLEAYEGRSAERSSIYTYEQEGAQAETRVAAAVKKNRAAWAFFKTRPPWYRRTAARWVTSAKKEETRTRRLATLIADSAAGRTIAPLTRPTGASAKTRKK